MSSMEDLAAAAQELAPRGIYLFFKLDSHFRNPLVASERALLDAAGVAEDAAVLGVVQELVRRSDEVPRGIYSPVPIARGLEAGEQLDDLLERFRYEMIVVDEEQEWWWQGRPVAPRIQRFFTEHLLYEPDLGLYAFEYRVNEEWWDKCYFEAQVTPLLVHSMDEREGEAIATLNNGQKDRLDLASLRLDDRERLFAGTRNYGEAMFSDALRFSVLRSVDEDCASVMIAGERRSLHWPEQALC